MTQAMLERHANRSCATLLAVTGSVSVPTCVSVRTGGVERTVESHSVPSETAVTSQVVSFTCLPPSLPLSLPPQLWM